MMVTPLPSTSPVFKYFLFEFQFRRALRVHCCRLTRHTHPKTETAYAWSDSRGNFTAVLGVPPATDPRNAVKVSIVAAAKK